MRHPHTVRRLIQAHALLPRPAVYWSARRCRPNGRPVRDLTDIGLNGLTPATFRRELEKAGLRALSLSYNCGSSPLLRAMSLLRRVPPLERYMTVSIYAVLTPADAALSALTG